MLAAYLQSLRQRVTERHADSTETTINNVLAATRCAFLKDLQPERIEGYLAGLQDTGKLAARSMNAPLVALKAMLNWAVHTRRIPFNPLTCIKATTGGMKRKRRALSEIEITALLTAALEGPTRRGRRARENRREKMALISALKLNYIFKGDLPAKAVTPRCSTVLCLKLGCD